MFYFHKVAYIHCLGEVDISSYMSKQIYFSLQQCKNYKNRSRFSKVMVTNVLPPFLWFTVYIHLYFTITGSSKSINEKKIINLTK